MGPNRPPCRQGLPLGLQFSNRQGSGTVRPNDTWSPVFLRALHTIPAAAFIHLGPTIERWSELSSLLGTKGAPIVMHKSNPAIPTIHPRCGVPLIRDGDGYQDRIFVTEIPVEYGECVTNLLQLTLSYATGNLLPRRPSQQSDV